MAKDFQIISSIRSDHHLLALSANNAFSAHPPKPIQFYMFQLHHHRMLSAAQAFHWPDAVSTLSGPSALTDLETALSAHISSAHDPIAQKNPLRIRIQLSRAGQLSFVSAPTPPVHSLRFFPSSLLSSPPAQEPASWTIYLYPLPIASGNHTWHKTTARAHYDAARADAPGEGGADVATELLLQNAGGEVMEGSLTTPYFWREGRWVTPRDDAGGNRGTTRRWALEAGLCFAGIVRAADVVVGEVVWLSNGVRGFGWGIVRAWKWD